MRCINGSRDSIKGNIIKVFIISGPGRTNERTSKRTNGYEVGKNWFTNRVVDEWN